MSEHSVHSEHTEHSVRSEQSEHNEHSERSAGKTSCAHDPDGSGVVDLKSAATLPRPHVPDMRADSVTGSGNGRDSVNRFLELSGEYLSPSPLQLESGQEQLVAGVVGGRPVRIK